ncbi:hypothetical protein K493DRAFT_320097 [Basidiobolus meristosporus CBS 931.73]|uniref:Uncharacterized protein n=1 Tax=Basidiobolus meristosporus CBS 931.73 TaxID=1314790 RepID=A0A1Y1XFH6_9FUNG|nr:hypothetical protein K493DRAFT_320097 [Basidiobolus meristosporus CBS 931.73]|eukprot:ORX84510.1 hypothetical protein K493DRAFT_320097 [Basidiobolus meristosporus CBS 931.73]
MNSVPNRNKQPELFEISQSPNGMFEDVPLRLAQFQDALHSWNNRLPLEYRYDAFRNVCRDPAQAAENPHTSAHIHILKLIHLGYLKSWLHVHHIRVTLHWNTEDMGIVKGCLETAEALTSIVRSLPDNELVDEPVTLSNCILACSVLVTFIEYILHSMTRKLNPAEYSTRLGSVEKWQLAMQAKRHINTIHDRFSSIVTVWRYSTLDLSRLAEIRAIAQHRCTQIHAQIMALPLSSLQGKSIPNPLELRNVAIPSDLDTIYHECDSIKEVPNSGLVLPDNQGA